MANLSSAARRHRSDVSSLNNLARSDLAMLFRQFDTVDAAKQGLLDVLPRLVQVYGSAAATLGADWYDDQRDKAAVRKRFSAIPADLPDRGRTNALAGWAVKPLYQADPDYSTALLKAAGGLQRIIANADRFTIAGSSVEDPSAHGWAREGSGECAFCALLIGRGQVYTEASADFASHDHCQCVAVPAFDGEPKPVKTYTPGPRNGTEADYARARAYIADH